MKSRGDKLLIADILYNTVKSELRPLREMVALIIENWGER